tara:strand:- start:2626 stop:3300 length:675 start_codon:yes stop_codon:yes gene_type:complete
MAGLKVTTEPTIEPISIEEAKEHLRLDDDVDDIPVKTFIKASRLWAEKYTGRAFITRTVQQYLDSTASVLDPLYEGMRTGIETRAYSNYIELAASPAISVTSINYYNDSDTQSTWATSNYYVDTVTDLGRVYLRDGGTFPTDLRAANGLEINYTAGYGASRSDIPDDIRLAMLQYMTFAYEHRGEQEGGTPPMPPKILSTLLNPYKIIRLGVHPYANILRTGIS